MIEVQLKNPLKSKEVQLHKSNCTLIALIKMLTIS